MEKGAIIFITADLMMFYRLKTILDYKHIAYYCWTEYVSKKLTFSELQ